MNIIRRFVVLAALGLVSVSEGAQQGIRADPPSRPMWETRHAGAPRPITERQRANLRARIELANTLVDRYEAEALARGLASEWRITMLQNLLVLPLAALERVSHEATGIDSVAALSVETGDDPTVLGNPGHDLVYTPIPPCRFVDTRNAIGSINGLRYHDLDSQGGLYGGQPGCNPRALVGSVGAVFGAFAANLTIVDPTSAPGFAAIKPTVAAPTSSLVNWYQAGPGVQVANAGIFQPGDYGGGFFDNSFVIQTSAPAHAILDLLGFFVPPQATALQLSIQQVTSPIGDGASGHLVSPNCPVGYTLTGGGCYTDAFDHILESTNPAGANAWECWTRNNSGQVSNLTAYAMCARLPGR